jgi:predicted GNAT family acetyltransferase
MDRHPLDNPIWTALTTSQAHFAEGDGLARKFQAEIGPLAGFAEPTGEAYVALGKLVRVGTGAALFLEAPANAVDVESGGFRMVEQDSLLQMIYSDCELPACSLDFVKLTEADVPEMVALATMMKPGPFKTRTRELGNFIGVKREGQLAAMAGERMRITSERVGVPGERMQAADTPGYTEISAVCTHPNQAGHGFATALMVELIGQIRRRNEIPILHVRSSNTHAIGLYHRIGFADRRHFHFAVIGKTAS